MAIMGVGRRALGHRFSCRVFPAGTAATDDLAGRAFLVTVSVPLILIGMSWIGFRFLRREGMEARWRMWMALLGCVALSVSLAIPFFVPLFGLPATQWTVWIFGASVVALLSGMFAPPRLKFPLMFGGLVMGGLLFIIPIGIL
jgi:hypothetical protein